jgi:hypothetical protein
MFHVTRLQVWRLSGWILGLGPEFKGLNGFSLASDCFSVGEFDMDPLIGGSTFDGSLGYGFDDW